MAQITALGKIRVPLGGQEIDLQQIDHVEGGMSLLRIRIREGKRFTIFDIDPATAQQWADMMQHWATPRERTNDGP
ncbi:MAG: hypothetical protein IPM27_06510 [Nitrosomonadales bacterium]|nr:hypothetical protein [Nitrosomonadales bacterium]